MFDIEEFSYQLANVLQENRELREDNLILQEKVEENRKFVSDLHTSQMDGLFNVLGDVLKNSKEKD